MMKSKPLKCLNRFFASTTICVALFGCKEPLLKPGIIFTNPAGSIVPPINLTPVIKFQTIKDANSGEIFYSYSWKIDGGDFSAKAGNGVDPKEPYIYYWDNTVKTLWFADPKFTIGIDLSKSPTNTSSWTSTTQGYGTKPEIPEKFKNGITEMLAGVPQIRFNPNTDLGK